MSGVAVMRAASGGALRRVVEHAATEDVFTSPRHDYTRQLLAAVPGAGAGYPGANDLRR